MTDSQQKFAEEAEEIGYTRAILDLREILLEEMVKGYKTIDLWQLDDRMQEMLQIRSITNMAKTLE